MEEEWEVKWVGVLPQNLPSLQGGDEHQTLSEHSCLTKTGLKVHSLETPTLDDG